MTDWWQPFIGLQVGKYEVTDYVGKGKIGLVFKARNRNLPTDIVACKLISPERLKTGWERELERLTTLNTVPNIAHYRDHGTCFGPDKKPFVFVHYDFVNGRNLKEYLAQTADGDLALSVIEWLAEALLMVLHACEQAKIVHGDIHEGNILIEDPNPLLPTSARRVVVADFGYGGSHNAIKPKEDRHQIFSIISRLLGVLKNHELTARDKILRKSLLDFCKALLERDATQLPVIVGNGSLYERFQALRHDAEMRASSGQHEDSPGRIDDYLVAEAMGTQAEPWRTLFVPDYVAVDELLGRHNMVLTGARGCGKTMAFRRMTVLMDLTLGSKVDIAESISFSGFYLNSRTLVEAFPWTPKDLNRVAKCQVVNYFNLCWFSEFTKTIGLLHQHRGVFAKASSDFAWLADFVRRYFPHFDGMYSDAAGTLSYINGFLEKQREATRLAPLGKEHDESKWTLRDFSFLDAAYDVIAANVPELSGRPFYLFLDDYTIPIVTKAIQVALNPVIFKRRENIFFKISSEASNSFLWTELNGKPLEPPHDFRLVDLASETFHWKEEKRIAVIEKILQRRIERDVVLRDRATTLEDLLGDLHFNNNKAARTLREKKKVTYAGVKAFVGMWSSDVRSMIKVLTDLISTATGRSGECEIPIPMAMQDDVFRRSGGEFLSGIRLNQNPVFWTKDDGRSTGPGIKFGAHLARIAEAFVQVARWELTNGKLVDNQGLKNPKQAFRIEIVDDLNLDGLGSDYYEGLIRWHVFLQDWRGKSVRGFMTPRLYLNRLILPFSNLTFSKHDNISMRNVEFIKLLKEPGDFLGYWKVKKSRPDAGQEDLQLE